ncbi:regulatory protein LuxR [Desulfurispirillum indicum S5]|uniref:Regulatory protein LuxR n=1 Tax=Desulfurispirillum indicum (strain ATCC BAA-1389 / DSM 22839 / S5) TaxID=653733 RepID=E6W1G5_DESIS|nr:LuxR C-terminal-related transcriptional regulator [Desulfurispirillum indicum]ADU65421.1 regulatory protein LuxR [Desulfurispirillum indicum S5]
MSLRELSRSDLLLACTAIQQALNIEDQDSMHSLLSTLGNCLDFTCAIICLVEFQEEQPLFQTLVQHQCPEPWLETYVVRKLWRTDPVFQQVRRSPEPLRWSQTQNRHSPNPALLEASRHGLTDGISIGYGAGNRTLISLAGSRQQIHAISSLACRVLPLLAPLIHSASVRIAHRQDIPDTNLSERERELLFWTAEGKSTEEISMILAISRDTVKYHLKRIYQKLDAVNRHHAIAKALRAGLIQ